MLYCMERDRPLKRHLWWGHKHVFLINIHPEDDYKKKSPPLFLHAGRRILSLQIPFVSWRKAEVNVVLYLLWCGMFEGPWRPLADSRCWDCRYCINTPIRSSMSPTAFLTVCLFFSHQYSLPFFPLFRITLLTLIRPQLNSVNYNLLH